MNMNLLCAHYITRFHIFSSSAIALYHIFFSYGQIPTGPGTTIAHPTAHSPAGATRRDARMKSADGSFSSTGVVHAASAKNSRTLVPL